MTAYFDEKGQRLQDIARRFAETKDHGDAAMALEALDLEVVRDVSIATADMDFPKDLIDRIDGAVLKYSVASLPLNAKPKEIETVDEHVRLLCELVGDLHTIFHAHAERDIKTRSDDPRSFLRKLYTQAEERRERAVTAANGEW